MKAKKVNGQSRYDCNQRHQYRFKCNLLLAYGGLFCFVATDSPYKNKRSLENKYLCRVYLIDLFAFPKKMQVLARLNHNKYDHV